MPAIVRGARVDRTDRDIGLAGERAGSALREVREPRQHRGPKCQQARRGIGNELPPGGAAAGLLESDDGLARQDIRFAVRTRGPTTDEARRSPGPELARGTLRPSRSRRSRGRGRIHFRHWPRGCPAAATICADRGSAQARSKASRSQRAVPRIACHPVTGPHMSVAYFRPPCSNTRRASGRRLPAASSVRHTSSSPRV